MNRILKISNVTLAYDKEPVLKNVNLEVFQNDFIGVIGPNGGGKTTLLKGILGLLKPVEGEFLYGNESQKTYRPIGYLPQVRYIDKKFPIIVADVVRSGLAVNRGKSLNRKQEKDIVDSLLDEMGITSLKDNAIGDLSGGQMQRVFLCRALAGNPELLILDEPDTFVDNRFEGELYEKLRELNEKVAIILVSHDIGTISSYVKTIACVNRNLYYHPSNKISAEQLEAYNCPIQVISHGVIPHTVLQSHNH